jgi:mRNA-degrading endonuclease toxin of MazEF toxin-antitoxin module
VELVWPDTLTPSGDVVDLDLGRPEGREAGFPHPAIVITAQGILDANPSVVHVVPLTGHDSGVSFRDND